MAPSDPKQGGDLFDMAKDGTSMPNDAGKMNLLPSVPRPDQITDPATDPNNLGSVDVEGAADNATDISRVGKLYPSSLSTLLYSILSPLSPPLDPIHSPYPSPPYQ